MLVSLSKDQSSQPGEILAHVEVSASDDLTKLKYSHSFRYKVPSGKDGEIVVYANKKNASKDVKGDVFLFDLEKCRNKDCKTKNPDGCPVIAGKGNRLLVADVFHTMPTQNTLQQFGMVLFKALFSYVAGLQLQEAKSTHQNNTILLQLNDQDLDAIPWEYANDGATFLVHSHKFARIFGRERERPQDPLPKLPLRIVVAAPDPLDLPEWKLADLHLSDQFQNLINEFRGDSIKIMLERVLPATVNKLNSLLAKHNDKMATVFHFMGHCVSHTGNEGARGLLFEDKETFQCTIAHTQNLITIPMNLRLAFLSACDSREVARDLAQNGVRYTIGSYCSLPDNIARKSEAQFYHYLSQGLSVNEAMWRTRMYFQHIKELRQSNYFAGVMILYSTTCQTADNTFLYESGKLKIEQNMFPNNINIIPSPKKFFGYKKQLADLNGILRRMVTHTNDSFDVCTITGIGGQGKTAIAKEAISRACHFFPGGIFIWRFDDELEISAGDYLRNLNKVLFSNDAVNDDDEVEQLGQAISIRFQASTLLILDHAETLKRAAAGAKKDADFLIDWLQRILVNQDISVKILATSQESLGWPGEEVISLKGLTDSDIHSGCKLFVNSLNHGIQTKIAKEKNTKLLLQELVKRVDGHPLSLKLLGDVVSLPKYRDKLLEDIVHEHYDTMLTDVNQTDKSLEKCFGPIIDGLSKPLRQILYLCCLFTGPITDRVLIFVSYFLNNSIDAFSEIIKDQLRILCECGLLKQMKDNSYNIQVALREAVSQRNTKLCLQLHLQTSGNYADAFVIGVLTSSTLRKSVVLDWLFRELKSNPTNSQLKTKNLCVEYYLIKKAGCECIDLSTNSHHGPPEVVAIEHTLPLQLLVFIYKVSAVHYNDNLPGLYLEYIISIITKKKLPFILCLDYVEHTYAEDSAVKIKTNTLMKEAAILRASLAETHAIIVTNVSSKENKSASKLSIKADNLESKTALRAYSKSLTDVYMEGNFFGRENELKMLNTLLNNDTHQYITIKGFGGIGKTCLAIQAAKNFNSGSILALSLIGIPTLSSVIRKIAQFLIIEIKELNPQSQQAAVIERLESRETILLYLDNMEDIRNANDRKDLEAKGLMNFFRRMPKNVKILATSRVTLGWPNEEIVELHGLTPSDGMNVFRQWSSQRKNDINDDSVLKLSELLHGHSLSLRLLGGVFGNCDEPMDKFLNNISNKLSIAVDSNSATERHESINACIEYSFRNLDPALRSLLGQLKSFEIPFCKTIAARALRLDITLIANNLYNLWQRSWLNQRIYQEDPMLGDWRPRSIEKDTKFYSLHPRLRDFLDEQFKNVEDANSAMLNDREIQFYTALCYGVGFGVANRLDKQIEWCTRAAKNEHLEAQLILATCYETGGGGVGEDQKEASNWYLKAAEAGDKGAQEEMGQRFYSGKGVMNDYDKWVHWTKLCNDNKTTPLKIKFDFSLPLVHRATEYGALDLVKSLIEQRPANVDIKDRHGRTPLHVAAEKGRIDIFQLLALEFGADISAKDKEGGTLFHWAANGGQVEIMSVLEDEFGAYASIKDEVNQTPLHWAVKSGQIEATKVLMVKVQPTGLNLLGNRIGTDGARALGESLKQNTTLTRLNLEWNGIGDDGACALGESLKQNTTLTQLNLGSNRIGADGARALGESLKQNTTITQLNLSMNGIGDDGARALGESLKQNTTLTQLNLLDNGIGADGARALAESLMQNMTLTQLNLEWNDIIDFELLYPREISDEILHDVDKSLRRNTVIGNINLLVTEFGADANVKNNSDRVAAIRQRTEMVQSLLTDTRSTLLHIIAAHGHIGVAKILADADELGTDTDAQDGNAWTPLHMAASRGHVEIARLLVLEHGADVNTKANDGQTPLHRAAGNGHVEMVKVLISELGADLNVQCKDGLTPLQHAEQRNRVNVASLITQLFDNNKNDISNADSADNVAREDPTLGGSVVEMATISTSELQKSPAFWRVPSVLQLIFVFLLFYYYSCILILFE